MLAFRLFAWLHSHQPVYWPNPNESETDETRLIGTYRYFSLRVLAIANRLPERPNRLISIPVGGSLTFYSYDFNF